MLSSSEYLQKKRDAADVYLARRKTVDASLLTSNRSQIAVYGGGTSYATSNPVIVPVYTNQPPTDMYTAPYAADSSTPTNKLSQQQDKAFRAAGGVIANDVKYSTASPVLQKLNCEEVNTILHPYQPKNYPSVKAECRYTNRYFPSADSNSSCKTCSTDKTVFSSG